jgi:oligopeptide transport system permease protein
VLLQRLPVSAKLGLVGILFAVLLGPPLGVVSALRQNSWIDYASLTAVTIGISVPNFIIAILAIILLSSTFGMAPIHHPEDWNGLTTAYLLPGLVLGLGTMAYVARLTRAGMLEIKRRDYVRTARAKGLPEPVIVARHMLRNALIPTVTILGPAIADLVVGSFIIESIFNVPGMSWEFLTAIAARDYSMIIGITLV